MSDFIVYILSTKVIKKNTFLLDNRPKEFLSVEGDCVKQGPLTLDLVLVDQVVYFIVQVLTGFQELHEVA